MYMYIYTCLCTYMCFLGASNPFINVHINIDTSIPMSLHIYIHLFVFVCSMHTFLFQGHLGRSLGGPWEVPVGPWGVLGTPGPPLRIPWVVPEGLQGIAGRFLGVPGPPRESLRGPWEYLGSPQRPEDPPLDALDLSQRPPWASPDMLASPQPSNQESTILVASVQGYLARSLGDPGGPWGSLGTPGPR